MFYLFATCMHSCSIKISKFDPFNDGIPRKQICRLSLWKQIRRSAGKLSETQKGCKQGNLFKRMHPMTLSIRSTFSDVCSVNSGERQRGWHEKAFLLKRLSDNSASPAYLDFVHYIVHLEVLMEAPINIHILWQMSCFGTTLTDHFSY